MVMKYIRIKTYENLKVMKFSPTPFIQASIVTVMKCFADPNKENLDRCVSMAMFELLKYQ